MRYHNITKDDMLNGEGLRVVLWVAGCDHCCPQCHNPLTWDAAGGLEFDQAAKDELFAQLEKDYIAGVTFSGGDPLHSSNRLKIRMLSKEIKEKFPTKTIWIYTGSLWEEVCEMPFTEYADVLIDGEFLVEFKDLNLLWKGSSNQRVVDVQATIHSEDRRVPILYCGDYE